MVGTEGKSGGKRVGAGRPVVANKKKTKSLTVSLEAHSDIEEIAKKTNKKQSVIFEKLVKYGKENLHLFE